MNAVVKILSANEPWVEYQLEDRTLVRFRFTACSFRRTGNLTAQGDPEYAFAQSIMSETVAAPVVAEVRQLPRLVSGTLMAVGFAMSGDLEPIGSQYIAPDSDVG